MKKINIRNWDRRKHFEFFSKFDYPHFSVCFNVNITKSLNYIRKKKYSLFKCILFAVMNAVNEIEEFRYRIRGKEIIIHKNVDAGITVLTDEELYSNSIVKYSGDFNKFILNTETALERGKKEIILEEKQKGKDNLVFITCLPWISFTSVMHPVRIDAADSIPRIAWGKYFRENKKVKLPLSVQVNHCLMDGIQVAKFYNYIQEIFNSPDKYFRIS